MILLIGVWKGKVKPCLLYLPDDITSFYTIRYNRPHIPIKKLFNNSYTNVDLNISNNTTAITQMQSHKLLGIAFQSSNKRVFIVFCEKWESN